MTSFERLCIYGFMALYKYFIIIIIMHVFAQLSNSLSASLTHSNKFSKSRTLYLTVGRLLLQGMALPLRV